MSLWERSNCHLCWLSNWPLLLETCVNSVLSPLVGYKETFMDPNEGEIPRGNRGYPDWRKDPCWRRSCRLTGKPLPSHCLLLTPVMQYHSHWECASCSPRPCRLNGSTSEASRCQSWSTFLLRMEELRLISQSHCLLLAGLFFFLRWSSCLVCSVIILHLFSSYVISMFVFLGFAYCFLCFYS